MAMVKLLIISALVLIVYALTCGATQYMVGDNSGWDISTDLDTWAKDKKFLVGDVLLFQYSSSHSVSEVPKENYEGCNTTNVLQSGSNGNTSFVLSSPGDRYFICGNKLHCYGGMKLHVNVENDQGTGSPVEAPKAQPGTALPPPNSKSKNPDVTSSAYFNHVTIDYMFISFFGFLVLLFGVK
ncbi:Cupredoxin superfamily protein [Forsythia ovata]|uniref:Cupredoxin superfamily protein n=1 Tax=Forsythia ovata TaxID=205694 RepID=A0ABD1X1U8_9LAMI